MRVLKIARNFLRDDDIALLADAIHDIPSFMDLDIAGNCCREFGAEALRRTLLGHSALCDLG